MGKFGDNKRAQILYEHKQITTGALVSKDVVGVSSGCIDGSTANGFRILKVEGNVWTVGMTAGEGPILFGLAGPDVVASEVEEALEADPQSGIDDPASSFANRPVWILGLITYFTAIGWEIRRPFEKKINWSFPEGSALQYWVYNLDTATLSTFEVDVFLKIYGVWLND